MDLALFMELYEFHMLTQRGLGGMKQYIYSLYIPIHYHISDILWSIISI